MVDNQTLEHELTAEEEGNATLFSPRRTKFDSELDMTPMIDCVFLLLIYFLVASRPDDQALADLPQARYGDAVSAKNAIIISIAAKGTESDVYLADGKKGPTLTGNEQQQDEEIRRYVEEGKRGGKKDVLLKAEKYVLHKHVSRVARSATQLEGLTLYLAVMDQSTRKGGP